MVKKRSGRGRRKSPAANAELGEFSGLLTEDISESSPNALRDLDPGRLLYEPGQAGEVAGETTGEVAKKSGNEWNASDSEEPEDDEDDLAADVQLNEKPAALEKVATKKQPAINGRDSGASQQSSSDSSSDESSSSDRARSNAGRKATSSGLNETIQALCSNQKAHSVLVKKAADCSTKEFFLDTIAATDARPLLAIPTGKPHITVIHSTADFQSIEAEDDQVGLRGFIGDYGPTGELPTSIAVKESWFKNKRKVKVPKQLEALLDAVNEADHGKLWDGHAAIAADDKEDREAPQILPAFPALAKQALQRAQTPFQLRAWLLKFIKKNKLAIAQFKTHLNFLEVAACATKGSSMLAVSIAARFALHGTGCEATKRWMQARLLGTIGPPATQLAATPGRPKKKRANAAAGTSDGLAAAMTAMAKCVATLASTGASTSTPSKDKVPKFTERKLWGVTGFCQVASPTQIPGIWLKMLKADSREEARQDLQAEINNMIKQFGATEANEVQLPLSELDNLLALKLAPTSAFCLDNMHEGALSLESCLPRSNKEIMEMRASEERLELTPENQRTYALQEELQKKAGKKKAPTVVMSTFLSTTLVYAATHLALFGKLNSHAQKTYSIRQMILKKPLEEREAFCTPQNLLTLQFLISEDRSNYYSDLKSKGDIDRVGPSFPTSYLDEVVRDVRRGILHRPAQFPAAWRQGRPAEDDMTIGEQYGFGRALVPPPGSPPTFDDETRTQSSDKGWHTYVITEFKPLVRKIRKARGPQGHIPLGDACTKIGKELKDLPYRDATSEQKKGKKGLCFKFLMGKCGQGA
ncbi:hypothetical protein THAOC_25854, partial [Thalassiosira oceanica]